MSTDRLIPRNLNFGNKPPPAGVLSEGISDAIDTAKKAGDPSCLVFFAQAVVDYVFKITHRV